MDEPIIACYPKIYLSKKEYESLLHCYNHMYNLCEGEVGLEYKMLAEVLKAGVTRYQELC